MRYPEFKQELTDYCQSEMARDPENGLYIIRALGRTTTNERLRFKSGQSLGVRGIPEPYIAVVSSGNGTPQERSYGLLAANSAYYPSTVLKYPVININCKVCDRGVSDPERAAALGSAVFLETVDDRLEDQARLWFVDGYQDSLVFNGAPTGSAINCEIQNLLHE